MAVLQVQPVCKAVFDEEIQGRIVKAVLIVLQRPYSAYAVLVHIVDGEFFKPVVAFLVFYLQPVWIIQNLI